MACLGGEAGVGLHRASVVGDVWVLCVYEERKDHKEVAE